MSINIPANIFDKYNEVVDYMLENDNFSRICTLHYPTIKEVCVHCVGLAGNSVNSNQYGGPAPFNFNSCVYCGGAGYREKEVTGTIRLRIFWRPRDWIKSGNIAMPDATCQVIGKVSDFENFMSAQYISLISQEGILEKDYKLSGKPFLHGFGKTRYFVAYMEDA